MKSRASSKFWRLYVKLPRDVQHAANKQYELWLENHGHPSVHFKKTGLYWSARITGSYRALGIMDGETVIWFWIGNHDEYEEIMRDAQ